MIVVSVALVCASACMCVVPPLPPHLARQDAQAFYEQVAWDEATDVFTGTVVSAEIVAWQPHVDSILHLEEGDPALDEFDRWQLRPVRFRYTLIVSDVWKGTTGGTVVVTGLGFTSCDRTLALGESYVIYGRSVEGTIPISLCTPTFRRSEADFQLRAMARRRAAWQ